MKGAILILKPNFKLQIPTCYYICIKLVRPLVDSKNIPVTNNMYPDCAGIKLLNHESFSQGHIYNLLETLVWAKIFQSIEYIRTIELWKGNQHIYQFIDPYSRKYISFNRVRTNNWIMKVSVAVTSIKV